jgi:hypothetical protein
MSVVILMFFFKESGQSCSPAAAVELFCSPVQGGGGGAKTTVDQTLMRGLVTARPFLRLGPASVSSRASAVPATESHRGLPCRPMIGFEISFSFWVAS